MRARVQSSNGATGAGKRLRAYQATEENFTSLRRGKEIWLDRLVSWIGFCANICHIDIAFAGNDQTGWLS